MKKRTWLIIETILIAISLLLSACAWATAGGYSDVKVTQPGDRLGRKGL